MTETNNKNKSKNQKNNKESKAKKNSAKDIFKAFFITFFTTFLICCVVVAGYVVAIIKSLPNLDINSITSLSEASSFYDNNGELMDSLNSEIQRTVINYDEMPQYLKDAIVSIEDQRFYEHNGIDVRRIVGSFVTDVTKILKGDTSFHGGSTITQQLLKNTILQNEDSAIERKIKEIYTALELEKKLSKDQILCQYLNTIPFGGTTYGAEAAAYYYFNKPAKELNLIQCAYIAGVTQSPTYYGAYIEKNIQDPSPYINRTKTVLGKMKELGKISEEEYNNAISSIDNGELTFERNTDSYVLDYEWYINPALKQVKEALKEKYSYDDDEAMNLLLTGGLKIYTNMDKELQDYTQSALDGFDAGNVGMTEEFEEGTNTPKFQASATIVDYHNGKVLAMVGGRGEHAANANNRAFTGLKPIGSNTKPLTVYGPAINEKILTAGSTIDDSPLINTIGSKYPTEDGPYNPQNDNGKYSGNITLRESLTQSKNVGAVIVEDKIGINTGLFFGKKFGLKYNSKSSSAISCLALGQFNNDPNDLDGGNTFILSSAFGVFGNGGIYTEPLLYSKVLDSNGNTLLEVESSKTKEIFNKETAYIIYDILKGSCSYTGPNAKWGDMPVAGKTGTTSSNTDYWFSGVTPYLSASVWLGYDTPKEMGGNSNAAASLWGNIMSKAHEGKEIKDINKPNTLVTASICKDSGMLATDLCRADSRKNRVYTEYFTKDTIPTGYCEKHVSAKNKIYVKKENPSPLTEDYSYVYTKSNNTSTSTANKKSEDKNKN